MKPADIEEIIRHTANRLGIDVHRYRPTETLPGLLTVMLAHHDVNLLLDVGANTGQFAKAVRNAGYRGRIVSFEPLVSAHTQLLQDSNRDTNWFVADRAAIGAEQGEVEINIAANSFSSSVLDTLPNHEKAAPDSSPIGIEKAALSQLDVAAKGYVLESDVIFCKIDT